MIEEHQQKDKQTKTGRQRYFQIFINAGFCGPKLNLLTHQTTSLIDLLKTSNFVSQRKLEKTFYNLTIEDRRRTIRILNFDGQLERDQRNGVPYWHIGLQTSSLTTARSIARSLSKELFETNNTIDSTIKIRATTSFQRCQREKRYALPDSEWFPGYFNQTTVKLVDLLKTEEVRESIKDTPERYRVLIIGLVNSAEIEG